MHKNVLFAALGVVLLAACGNGPQQQVADEGGVYLSARGSALMFEDEISCVGLYIQPHSGSAVHGQMFNSNPGHTDGVWQFRIDRMVTGMAWVTARAYGGGITICDEGNPGAGAALYQVENVPFDIVGGQTTVGTLWLQETHHANPFKNSAPYITSLLASSNQIVQGELIQLNVTATDPDVGAVLSYAWSTSPSSAYPNPVNNPTWTAPDSDADYLLTVTVRDEKGASASASIMIHVNRANARGALQADIFMNNWPHVTGISSSNNETPAGQPFQLQATATDDDGDALQYTWDSNCTGVWDGSGAMVSFTPAGLGFCKIVVTVTDPNGGSGTGEIDVTVVNPVVASGPQFMLRWLSPFMIIAPDGVKRAEAVAIPLDNDISNKTFKWCDGGHNAGNGTTGYNAADGFVQFNGADPNGGWSDVYYTPRACSSSEHGEVVIPITSYVEDNATHATNFVTVNLTVVCPL